MIHKEKSNKIEFAKTSIERNSKMNHYKHFTIEEREKILFLRAQNKTISEIARVLSRNKSSVSRELSRNKDNSGNYSPSYAQKIYLQRRKCCGTKKLLLNPIIRDKVMELFLKHQWSPEQISERLKLESSEIRISYTTIYRGIYDGLLEEGKLSHGQRGVARKLRHRGKTRHKKGCNETRGKIQISNDIADRPAAAEKRERIGDWEADTVSGKTGKACLVTLTDRKSRFLLCKKVEKKSSEPATQAIISLLYKQPCFTITPDRGKEFSRHKQITEALNNVPFYFPLPHHPWQRGSNENTNGLLREYFPKNTDISDVPDSHIAQYVFELNTRPRKCLDWKSPYEIYFNVSLHLT